MCLNSIDFCRNFLIECNLLSAKQLTEIPTSSMSATASDSKVDNSPQFVFDRQSSTYFSSGSDDIYAWLQIKFDSWQEVFLHKYFLNEP